MSPSTKNNTYNLEILCFSIEIPFAMLVILKVHSKSHLKMFEYSEKISYKI